MKITARSVIASFMAFLLVWALVPFAWADDVVTEENSTNEPSQIESDEQVADSAEAVENEANHEAAADEQKTDTVEGQSVGVLEENEASAQADTVTATPGWELIGTCEWKIDGGELTIRPAGNSSEGVLPSFEQSYEDVTSSNNKWPWNAAWGSDKEIPEYASIDIQGVIKAGKSLKGVFANLPATCKSIKGLSNLNTSKTTDISMMFWNSQNLEVLDVSSFDTSNVTNMSSMFYVCNNAVVNASNFNTSQVIDMSDMFHGVKSVQGVEGFNTSKVTNMAGMFCNYAGATLDLSKFDTSNVTDMAWMFSNCQANIVGINKFKTSKVTDMSFMFCEYEKVVDLSNFDTSNVTTMEGMFADCGNMPSLDISSFNTSKVTDMTAMFAGFRKLKTLDLSNFNTSKVTNMSGMFGGFRGELSASISLESVNLSSFDTSNVENFASMFDRCVLLTCLDLSSFDTRKADASNGMFSNEGNPNLNKISIGKNFTFQSNLPEKTWYNKEGQSFTPATIPAGIANTYATSMDLFDNAATNKTVALDQKEKTVRVNDSPFTLIATVSPNDVEDKAVVWSSSNSSVATVDAQGVVTPLQSGTTMITARSGLAAAVCYVTVNPLIISSTTDSVVEGTIAIHDADLAKELENYSLRIVDNGIENLTPLEQAIKEVSGNWNNSSYLVNVFDIDLVNNTTGDVYEWASSHRITLGIKMNEELQKLAETHNFNVWYVGEALTEQTLGEIVEERASWVDQGVLYFDSNHLSTYAVSATLKPVDAAANAPTNTTGDTEASVLAKTADSSSTMIMTLGLAGLASLMVLVGTSAYQSRRRDS